MNTQRIPAIVIGVVAAICILGYLGIRILGRIALKDMSSLPGPRMPEVPPMPPVVGTPMEEILARLEEEMKAKDPKAFEGLQPGLTDEEIASIEQEGGFQLPDDMKNMYKWHNGSTAAKGPIPLCRFFPLDEAVSMTARLRDDLKDVPEVARKFVEYRVSWISVFHDPGGYGYFFNPDGTQEQGSVFYTDDGGSEYVFFPSIKNLLAWIVKCYQEGAFPWDIDWNEGTQQGDIELSDKLRKEFGVEVSGY